MTKFTHCPIPIYRNQKPWVMEYIEEAIRVADRHLAVEVPLTNRKIDSVRTQLKMAAKRANVPIRTAVGEGVLKIWVDYPNVLPTVSVPHDDQTDMTTEVARSKFA